MAKTCVCGTLLLYYQTIRGISMAESTQDMINDKGLEALKEVEAKQIEEQVNEAIETHTSGEYSADNIRVLKLFFWRRLKNEIS